MCSSNLIGFLHLPQVVRGTGGFTSGNALLTLESTYLIIYLHREERADIFIRERSPHPTSNHSSFPYCEGNGQILSGNVPLTPPLYKFQAPIKLDKLLEVPSAGRENIILVWTNILGPTTGDPRR